MKMRGASWETYALVVTVRRLIMAQITADMLNAAYKEAAGRAKAEEYEVFARRVRSCGIARSVSK